MALTITEVCNQALGRVGAQRIMSIDDLGSKAASACKNVFETTVLEVARAADWNCLRKRVELGQLADAPAFEWTYQYQLPSDFVNLIELNGVDYVGQVQDDWEIEGKLLLTDAESAKIKYTAYVDDVSQWDPGFANAVAVLIAAKIATPMRQDEGLAQALMSEYQRVTLPQARQKDANERRVPRFDPTRESRFVNSRYYSTNG